MKKKIWFIRHGESLTNADENFKSNSFGGSLVSISKRGQEQAEELLKYFTEAPDLIVTSCFIRTKETAKPLLSKYPAVQHEEWPIHEFTYLSNKRCLNTSFLQRDPWREDYWQKGDPLYSDGDGAESFVDFMERVRGAIEKIKERKENFIVIFSHGYTIAAMRYVLEKNIKEINSEVMQDFRKYFKDNKISNTQKIEIIF